MLLSNCSSEEQEAPSSPRREARKPAKEEMLVITDKEQHKPGVGRPKGCAREGLPGPPCQGAPGLAWSTVAARPLAACLGEGGSLNAEEGNVCAGWLLGFPCSPLGCVTAAVTV